MTRTTLQTLVGKRLWFRGRVDGFGRRLLHPKSKNRPKMNVLLVDVCFLGSGTEVTDHVWVKVGQWSRGLRVGDEITFCALVTDYIKGNVSHTLDALTRPLQYDYKLTEVRNVKIQHRHNKDDEGGSPGDGDHGQHDD